MRPVPRLMPLLAVAIGGVVAVKALAGAQALPDLLAGASARAEEAPPRTGPGAPTVAAAKPPPLPPSAMAPPPRAAPVCAQSPAEIAKAAGLSPGELQTLQNLGARRGQLDDRERTLDTQVQLLAAAEAKVDAKMKALNALKAEMQGLLGQADQKSAAEIDRLVIVYSKMKPRDAAAIMATLDDRVRVPVAAKMKERNLADILAQMPTAEAKKLTEDLAHRTSPEALSQAADPPPAATAPPPAKTAEAAPPATADEASDTDKPAKLASAAARRPARRAAARRRALAHAKADTPTVAAAAALSPPTPAPAAPTAKQPVETAAKPAAPVATKPSA